MDVMIWGELVPLHEAYGVPFDVETADERLVREAEERALRRVLYTAGFSAEEMLAMDGLFLEIFAERVRASL